MTCTRCHGLMIEQACWERDWRHVSSRWPKGFYVWACANCGNYEDPTICFNRRSGPAMTSTRHQLYWTRIRELVAELEVA